MSAVISRRTVAIAAAIVAVATVLLAAPGAALAAAPAAVPATAPATQIVQFSTDGIHWSDSYTGALFGGVLLVPGGSADRAFYVRNAAGESAVLLVTLFDVATTDTDLADALTVTTSMPGRPGAPVPLSSARPCATLSQGQVLAAGAGIRLDTFTALADLNSTAGQARSVSFKLAVTLSSTDSAAPAPDSCPGDDSGTVVGIPDAGTPAGTGATGAPVYHLGASGWTAAPSASGPSTPIATTPTTPDEPESPAVRSLAANTDRLYQENVVALWLALAVLGVLVLLFVRPRQQARQQARQIGTGR